MSLRTLLLLPFLVVPLAACSGGEGARAGEPEGDARWSSAPFDVGTREERGELFDSLVVWTERRDAFVALPRHPVWRAHPLGLDLREAMRPWRDSLVAADTPERMYYALAAISNLRKDRHLRLPPVEGGLPFPDSFGIAESLANGPVAGSRVPRAAVELRPDFREAGRILLFVADHATSGPGSGEDGGAALAPGDRVLSVNGLPLAEYARQVEPYHRVPAFDSFVWQLGTWIPQRSVQFPRHFYGEALTLELERMQGGGRYSVTLPYVDPGEIAWAGHWERRYPGYTRQWSSQTFDLWLPEDDRPVVLLQWHGFQGDLPEAMDRLMAQAEAEGLLGRGVIVDATRSGGGSRGAYALQRLQPRPFKGSEGNLMVSDAMEEWVEDRIRAIRAQPTAARETLDGGAWLLDWLETDVRAAIAEGRRYTNDVPFKLAHLPKHSDGVLDPAPLHFQGGLVVLLGPKGGSHLDQFAAQVKDNGLGPLLGMPSGGYSNTWQAELTLRFPSDGRPIIGYQWSMGHSIRPNGTVLQWNPAEVDEFIPLTRENFREYAALLVARGEVLLEESRRGVVQE